MATQLTRKVETVGGSVTASLFISSKDPADDNLARKFGDIYLTVSGEFNDPLDNSFPPFIVDLGVKEIPLLLTTLPNQVIKITFDDPVLDVAVKQRQADLWLDALVVQAQSEMSALRARTDTISGTATVTI